ncbi:MAG: CRISPR-associated protein Cas4 [Candidatus Omnitrophica bacterium]|nr:CRISPR-associated protein Cas4 [Candidatus Omnitrophota bacterium]
MIKITGTHINYYFHCKRHLWFFSNSIGMEHTSELVAIGKFISESTYERKKHEIHFENEKFSFVIDFFDKRTNTIHEIKKSDKFDELHIWQVKFYIFQLKKFGIENVKGVIDYPKLKKTFNVELTPDDEKKLVEAINDILLIIKQPHPPKVIRKPFCRKCSYYELCYV